MSAQQPFTLQQVLSAPYASELSAAPSGHRFAWLENAEGRRNLWISEGKAGDARQLTHYSDDDGQDITDIAWSPDGSAIAYTWGGELGPDDKPANPAHLQRPTPLQVIVQPIAPGAPNLVIGEGHSPLWIKGGKGLFFIRDGQVFLARFADLSPGSCVIGSSCYLSAGAVGTPTAPTTLHAIFDRGEASHLTLSPDGKLLAFVTTRGHGQREHSYIALFDIAARKLSFPAASPDNDSAPIFSPDGKQLAWLRSPFVTPRAYIPERTSPTPWSIELASAPDWKRSESFFQYRANAPGSALPHLSTGAPHLFWAQTAEHGSPRIAFFSESSGWLNLYAMQVGGGHSGPIPDAVATGRFEVEDAAISADDKTLFFAANDSTADPLDADRRHLWRVDVATTGSKPQPVTHGTGIETHPTPSADGTALVALVADAQHPMHAALVGRDGSIASLSSDIPADYPASALVTPQQVVFPSTDNLTIHGQLFLPPHFDKTLKHAALLFFHGGPRREMLLGYPGMDYYSNAYAMNQYLASRGFIVLSVNYRGGIGYGLDFREADNYGPDGASEYNDALAAARYLHTRADVDPARIGVWGGSYGGYFTALALARNSDLFAAGVDFHGVHDWIREDNAVEWLRRNGEFESLAEQEKIAALAHASSPMGDVDKWRSPVLLIHGDDDPDVAYTQTPTLADALRARNVHVEELIYPDEVHDFLLHRDWLHSYEAAANFFERTLHPEK